MPSIEEKKADSNRADCPPDLQETIRKEIYRSLEGLIGEPANRSSMTDAENRVREIVRSTIEHYCGANALSHINIDTRLEPTSGTLHISVTANGDFSEDEEESRWEQIAKELTVALST